MKTAEQQREHRKANPETYRQYERNKRLKNLPAFRATRRRAIWKFRGTPLPTRPEPAQCEICGLVETVRRGGTLCGLQNDHDDIARYFRGWICNACNLGLGKLGDTIEGLERALAYLKRAQEQWSQTQPSPSTTSSPKCVS